MKLIILSPNLHLIFSQEQRKYLESITTVEYYETPGKIQDIVSLADNEAKIVALDPDFCDWKVTREDLDFMKNVKSINLQTTGFHYIDIEYLREKWIPVTNLVWFNTNAVAEQAIGMGFSVARKLPLLIKDGWKIDFEKYRWIELVGKQAGIIWLGKIGTRIAELTKAIGMKTAYWSKNSRDERFEYLDLGNLIESSDILFYALAKNSETEQLLTPEILSKFKNNSIVISIAHFHHEIFISLVENGKIGWFGCDDPVGKIEDFTGNIIPWAQLWWCTDESFKKNGEQWIESIEWALNWEVTNIL